MPFPTPKVEIAFDDGPYVVSPTWTDVTSYVREMSIDRGRSDDWGTFDGSASVVLSNLDRRFDPFNTAGPYYGKLLPRRQIRLSGVTTFGTFNVFRGFVDGWPPVWTDAGKDSTVTLSCMDALGLLASETLPADWSRGYILSTAPRHYYPCDDPIGPFTANQTLKDYGSVPLDMATTAAASSGSQLAVGLVNSSVTGTGSDAANSALGAVNNSPGSFSVSCWVIPDSSLSGSVFLQGYMNNHGFFFSFDNATGKFRVEVTEPTFGNSKVATTNIAGWDSGMPRMMSFTWNNASRAITIYIDGILIANTTANVGGIYIPFNELVNIGTGSVQQVIVWDGVQTQAVLQEIYRGSTAQFPSTTAQRFTGIIQNTPFSTALTSPPSAPASSVIEITDDAPRVASELQIVADSEYAPLFVDKAGVVTLYNQNQIRTQTRSIVSQGTYGAGGIAIGPEVALQYDGDSMRNQASITMSGGGVYIKDNATSQTAMGVAEQSLSTQVSTLADAVDIGNIVTGWGGQVYPKADPFEVVLSPSASADWNTTLERELNDRITLVVQPPTGGAITVPMLISRISHSVVPGEWRTTFEGSARWAAVFILNQSRLNSTDLLG
jgi:hypothetical protein